MFHTFLSYNLSFPSLNSATNLIMPTNDSFVLMDFAFGWMEWFQNYTPDIGFSDPQSTWWAWKSSHKTAGLACRTKNLQQMNNECIVISTWLLTHVKFYTSKLCTHGRCQNSQTFSTKLISLLIHQTLVLPNFPYLQYFNTCILVTRPSASVIILFMKEKWLISNVNFDE